MPDAVAAVSVPANLLLMGEYAVLEEGGLGIGIAPNMRATGSLLTVHNQPSQTPAVSIVGRLPDGIVQWPGDTGLLGVAAEYLSTHFPIGSSDRIPLRIELNSEAFFGPDGTKLGLGSSAAIIVALTALWLDAADRIASGRGATSPEVVAGARNAVYRTSLSTHRAAQGGRGSGYDVACSTYGGTLLFTGGATTAVKPLNLLWFPQIHLLRGTAPVRTVSAVDRYKRWSSSEPEAARAFLRESNRLVTEFAAAPGWNRAADVLAEYARLTVALGESIGVPATVDTPARPPEVAYSGEDPVVAKAVGAGDELAVVLGGRQASAGVRLTVSGEGLAWV